MTPLVTTVAGLLVVAGAMKLRAHDLLGLPELGLGLAAIAAPRPLVTALVAVAYAGFAAHSLRLAVAAGEQDCGCFGDAEAPAGFLHVFLNLACAVVALAAVIAPPPAIASLVADAPLAGAVLVAGVAASVYGLFLAYTALPTAWNSFQAGSVPET